MEKLIPVHYQNMEVCKSVKNNSFKLDVDPRRDDNASPTTPDVVLKNEGSMVQTCRNINVYVVSTNIC